jgi:hypothetical protein
MSLEKLLNTKEIRDVLRPLIAPQKIQPGWAVTVPPIAKYQPRIGTAFDYALRFGLAARGVGTPRERTVAESAVVRHRLEPDLAKRVEDAVALLRVLQRSDELTEEAARACVILAGFDVLFRAERTDDLRREPEPSDVGDVQALYSVVPWDTFTTARVAYLNPSFGTGSRLVGGADGDVVLDGLLIDLKTTKDVKVELEYLRQVVCYAILANKHGINGEPTTRGSITEVGIYFSRAGRLFRVRLNEVIAPHHQDVVHDALVACWARMQPNRAELR